MASLSREEIIRADKGAVWHPYTSMRRYVDEVEPFVIDRAHGVRIVDVDGKSYIDANSSWWVAALGHNHPRLVQALKQQADRLCHTSLAGVTHEPAARLAEELLDALPGNYCRVFYSDDGSTAVEAAMKMALQYWHLAGKPKKRFAALSGAFHGETLGVTSLGGVELFRRPFAGTLVDCVHVPPPAQGHDDESAFQSAVDDLERVVRGAASELAAVVVEPRVQGATGMRMYPARFLRRLAEVCRESNVLLIVDEVFTGYGRTGPMWAFESAGIEPDIVCTAKAFSGGMLPMAATVVTSRVYEAFEADVDRVFYYGHSFCGNPLGCAVAREVLAVYREEKILELAKPKAARIAEAFSRLGEVDGTRRARTLGMIGAIDLSANASYEGAAGWRAFAYAREHGVYLRPLGDVVYVAPPLIIGDADLSELLEVVEASVRHALS